MSEQFAVKIADEAGRLQTAKMGVDIYQEAETLNNQGKFTNAIEVFNSRFPHATPSYVEKYGTPFEQAAMHANLVTTMDPRNGFKRPTLAELRGGKFGINANGFQRAEQAGTIIAPDGSDALTVGGRLLFPMTILQWVTSSLLISPQRYNAVVAKLIAQTVSVNGALYATPVVNFDGPTNARAGAIAQGTEPDLIASITVSDTAKRIKTLSYGLSITDQALSSTSLDLVGLTLTQFGVMERYHRLQEDLVDCVNGSSEKGISALSSKTAQSYDAEITAAGVMSQKAYLMWMQEDWMSASYNMLLGDLDAYYKLERRLNRPTVLGDPGTGRADIAMDPHLLGMPTSVGYFETTPGLFGANTLIAIDTDLALRKVIDLHAAYSAIDRFVLQRQSQLRFDFGERLEPIFHDSRGWKKLTLTV